MSTYTPEELKRIQEISLEMADYFVKFCEENDLLCYFCGGGAIGALRHEGFIPWDDDLDFFMPREDYEKLIRIWNAKADSRYRLDVADKNGITGDLFVNIRNRDTIFIKEYQLNLDVTHGVPLDVLPLDGYPDTELQRKFQVMWAYVYSLFCAQRVPTNHGGLKALVSKLLLAAVPSKRLRYRIWKFAERRMTRFSFRKQKYTTELCSGPYYMQKKYRQEWFDDKRYESFEGKRMPVPVGAEEYLTEAFGDFMQMPPEEKQVAHHDYYYFNPDVKASSMKDKVSIIIPVFNTGEYLKDALDSVRGQTYKNLEIILVNDGSTDNSGTLCDEAAEKDDRVRVVHMDNGGLSRARNIGLDMATGEYIAFVDSDDWIHKDMIRHLKEGMDRFGADLAGCQIRLVMNRPTLIASGRVYTNDDILLIGDDIMVEWMGRERLNGSACTKLIRRSLLDGVRFPEGRIYEDTYFVQELFPKIRKAVISDAEMYYYYRGNKNSISRGAYQRKNLAMIEAYLKNLKEIKATKPHLEEAALHRLYWSCFAVMDKMVQLDGFEEMEDYKKLRRVMLRQFIPILRNRYLSHKRKLQLWLLWLMPEMYRKSVSLHIRVYGPLV